MDTIAAISSPPGRSARGLLRLSGPAVPSILRQLLDRPLRPREQTICRWASWRLPCMALRFTSPRSYTGQDMAEIQLPGNPALLDRALHQVLRLGARLAEPGEFTFQAFTAGKLDLTQAEGVAATIAATSDAQLRAADALRRGDLGRFAAALVDRLANALALLEAGIDFTDQEDVIPIVPAALHDRVLALRDEIQRLVAQCRSWSALEALPRVVMVGRPSTGKSTLFNALLGRRRAVTSEMPGTTRDVLREALKLRDARGRTTEVMLIDIAGLDSARTALDHDVQRAAHEAVEHADLILSIADGVAAPIPVPPGTTAVLAVRTKCDLPSARDQEDSSAIAVSAHTGEGLDTMRHAIARLVGDRAVAVSVSGQMLALQPRHEASLNGALSHLSHAQTLLAPLRASRSLDRPEIIAASLRAALDELASLGGHMTPDDVLGRVFATFCIGK